MVRLFWVGKEKEGNVKMMLYLNMLFNYLHIE